MLDFAGSVTNNSDAAITFQLTGVLHNFEPYVASLVDGIPFPGITLGPGASTAVMDLAIVTLQPFDPSLPYPGNAGIALEAINPTSSSIFTENDASIHVVTATPEPSAIVLLLSAFGGLLFAGMTSEQTPDYWRVPVISSVVLSPSALFGAIQMVTCAGSTANLFSAPQNAKASALSSKVTLRDSPAASATFWKPFNMRTGIATLVPSRRI